jgi:hypothetical protein
VVKPPQPIEIESVLINPHDLRDFVQAGGALPRKQGVVHEREPIVRRRITVGCGVVEGCTCRTYPDWHWSASDEGVDSPVTPCAHLVTEGDAARDGVGLGGIKPVHHIGKCCPQHLALITIFRCSVNTDHRTCEPVGSDANDGQEGFDASEVVDVSRVKGQVGG